MLMTLAIIALVVSGVVAIAFGVTAWRMGIDHVAGDDDDE